MWKTIGVVANALLWLWSIARWLADWVGRGLAVRDGPEFLLNLAKLGGETTPWVPTILAILLTGFLIYKIQSDKTHRVTGSRLADQNERVPLKELYRMAWDNPENKQGRGQKLIEISNAIRQVALDGDLPVWGRSNQLHALLEPVPREHWKDYWIDWIGCFLFTNGGEIDDLRPNANAASYVPGQAAASGYVDLHVMRADATKLLRQHGYAR